VRLLGVVLVEGESMLPTLRAGDCLLVLRTGRVRRGAVVVARLHDRPGLLVVKRAVERLAGEGWLLASDNGSAPGAVGGPGRVEAVVVLRWWPLPPRRLRPGPGSGRVARSACRTVLFRSQRGRLQP